MEKIFKNLSFISASFVLIVLLGIFISLFNSARPAMAEFGFGFITDSSWEKNVTIEKPVSKITTAKTSKEVSTNVESDDAFDDILVEDDDSLTKTIYGGLIPIVGTILSTLIAMVFALPIAMGIAVFLAEIAPKNISNVVGIAIELLAAIPSIIFGMWGLFYFAPIVQSIVGGYQVSLLTAGLVLGVMILPFMAAITRDSMKTTPDVLKESAYALGATKFEVIKDIIFPYSKSGIIGSIILALGRALGETMAVAFLIGSVFSMPTKLTDPTVSIPVAMANNFGEATGLTMSSLFYLAFLLFVISFTVISIAKIYFLRKVN
ncbi:phosphate ABC transporter, inner membrane subunit PstC [Arcobacter nitrofigilis DSM 7299]|uniref:Phosphate transport system permease protein n=1 Tax=Arcobacter nitrofigilis (strain ATCC 33309 / DSM 7299 / CCUG 15893 / LMG 7604 / NCTC 12251 / CI) TaxID=572480 RepID=D5V397_ARCNC|nr:phosphate ABC transporter permease subunit PstC [Arcobacter nitrofigilis]ADG92679.1 phosphate ABC transporter, inner membrane subunit PstC [Arcobacter nitrofigilis DSM 7299]